MSIITLCIKYALGYVTKEDVEWIFNDLFGEKLVTDVTEIVKKDRYNGKEFKMFFIKCDETNQKHGNLDRLVCKIQAKGMAKVTIDEHDHYWQVCLAIEKPKPKPDFKPRIVEEPTVEELGGAMEALQTDREREFLRGRKEDGEVGWDGKVFELELAHDDPIVKEALESMTERMLPNQVPR